MEIAMAGLGRMGLNMARRLLKGGHAVVAYNRTYDTTARLAEAGARGSRSPEECVGMLKPPRIVWLMLPAGEVTESHVDLFAGLMDPGDILVDGGNSFYKDHVRRSRVLAERGIHFLDAGVSGGIWGREEGYCLMVGGEEHAFRRIEPILQTLAPPEGYLRCGPAGSGHFMKMVHNGIEYALMQAYGEGFNIVKNSPFAETVPLEQLAHVWNRGSVVRSWLLELLEKAFRETPNLEVIAPYVEDSGEGRWTVQQAVESGTPAPVITLALFERFASRGNAAFSNTILAALRNQFGGHAVKSREA